ncbi:MAG: ribonuclease P protein component [Brevinematia bacterium]
MKNSDQEGNNFSFPQKLHKIRYLKHFRKLIKEGKNLKLSFGDITILENETKVLRIAISIRRKFNKKSTKRNRLKRIISEMLRKEKHNLKGFDIWIQIKKPTPIEVILDELKDSINKIKTSYT